jgi:hypothetical protein
MLSFWLVFGVFPILVGFLLLVVLEMATAAWNEAGSRDEREDKALAPDDSKRLP